MKNIVIAAGYATRLGELTRNFPKPLLKIGEKSILDRMLDDIDQIPDIDEHIIVTNHKFADIFRQWAEERSLHKVEMTNHQVEMTNHQVETTSATAVISSGGVAGVEKSHKPITIVDDGTETNDTRLGAVCDLILSINGGKVPLSNGKELSIVNSQLSIIDDDLLVVAADNLLFFSFSEFVKFAQEKGTSCIMCHEQPSIEKLQRTGVVELDDNMKVLGMEEKPQVPKSHWAVPPFYIYMKKDLDLVRHSVENGCGKDAPGNLAHYMVEHTTMHAWPMSAGRFDIGSLDTYYEAVKRFG